MSKPILSMQEYLAKAREAAARTTAAAAGPATSAHEAVARDKSLQAAPPTATPTATPSRLTAKGSSADLAKTTKKKSKPPVTPVASDDDRDTPSPAARSDSRSPPSSSEAQPEPEFSILGEQAHMKARLNMYLGATVQPGVHQLFGWAQDLDAAARTEYSAPLSYELAYQGHAYQRVPPEIADRISRMLQTAETASRRKRARAQAAAAAAAATAEQEGATAAAATAEQEGATAAAATAEEEGATAAAATTEEEGATAAAATAEQEGAIDEEGAERAAATTEEEGAIDEEEAEEEEEDEEEEEEVEPQPKKKRSPKKGGEKKTPRKKAKPESAKPESADEISDLSGVACLPVYFGRYPLALMHAIREVITNPFDEHAKGKPVSRIWYDVDPKTGWVSVVNDGSYIELQPYRASEDKNTSSSSEDDMRRIRTYEGRIIARIAVETKYAGSKFSQAEDESVARAGRNGLGLKIVNAVSHAFEIFVWDGQGRAYVARWEDHLQHLQYEKLVDLDMPADPKKPARGTPPWKGSPPFSDYIPAPQDPNLPRLLPGKPFFGVRFLPDYLALGVDRVLNPVAVVHRTIRLPFSTPAAQAAVEEFESRPPPGDARMSPVLVAAMESVAWETIAGCGCAKEVRMIVRGKVLPFRSTADMLASVVWTDRTERKPRILSRTLELNNGNRIAFSIALSPKWEEEGGGAAETRGGLESRAFSFGIVNSQRCDFGTHVSYVKDAISATIRANLAKKKGTAGLSRLVTVHRIQGLFAIAVEARVFNPHYSDQTKATLFTRLYIPNGETAALTDAMQTFVTAAAVSKIARDAEIIESSELKKTARANVRSDRVTLASGESRRVVSVPKYSHAAHAGVKGKSLGCTLILTEGDSAKGLAMAGLEALDPAKRQTFGVFPLKGNAITARRASMRELLDNAEAKSLAAILGLVIGKDYSDKPEVLRKDLNYGRVMIFSDQDSDGHKIAASVVDLLDCLFSDGTKKGGFVSLASAVSPFKNFVWRFATPIVKGAPLRGRGAETLKFMTESAFAVWRDAHRDQVGRYSWKYYKGLGTSSNTEAKEYFRQIETCAFALRHEGDVSDRVMTVMFDPRLVPHRKSLAMYPHQLREISWTAGAVPVHAYVLQTAVAYLHKFLHRHMPGVDGLKRSQRQVLAGALMLPRYRGSLAALETRGSAGAAKVSQIVPAISTEISYHHGEAAMNGTLIGLAQVFAGTQQIPLFSAEGQFGSRIGGPSDASEPRYIFTRLLEDVTQAAWATGELHVLNRCLVDEKVAEPIFFAPPVPGPLLNGCDGIATGWSTAIPPFRARTLIELTRAYIAILRECGGDILLGSVPLGAADSAPANVEESRIVAIDRESYREVVEAAVKDVELKIKDRPGKTDFYRKLMGALDVLRSSQAEPPAGDEDEDEGESESEDEPERESFRNLEFEKTRRKLARDAGFTYKMLLWSIDVGRKLIPAWDLYTGEIIRLEDNNKFLALGRYAVDPEHGTVTITELPPGVWTDPFVASVREKFVFQNRAEADEEEEEEKAGEAAAGEPSSSSSSSSSSSGLKKKHKRFVHDLDVDKAATYVHIVLHCKPEKLRHLLEERVEHRPKVDPSEVAELRAALVGAGLDPDQTRVFLNKTQSADPWTRYPRLEKALGLTKPISIANMQIFDARHRLRHVRSLADFWNPCADAKLSTILAKLRRRYHDLDRQARRLTMQARFARSIAVDHTLDIRNMALADLHAHLRAEGYSTDRQLQLSRDEAGEEEEEAGEEKETWNYLRMDLLSITRERVEKLLEQVKQAEQERDVLLRRSIYDVWMEELDALETKLPELAVYKIRTVFGSNV